MQSFFDLRGPRIDTNLPSVRYVQELIRNRTVIQLQMMGGQILEGTVKWQDNQFLALRQDVSEPLLLVNREAIVILRALV